MRMFANLGSALIGLIQHTVALPPFPIELSRIWLQIHSEMAVGP